jgi:hypothetical protein
VLLLSKRNANLTWKRKHTSVEKNHCKSCLRIIGFDDCICVDCAAVLWG